MIVLVKLFLKAEFEPAIHEGHAVRFLGECPKLNATAKKFQACALPGYAISANNNLYVLGILFNYTPMHILSIFRIAGAKPIIIIASAIKYLKFSSSFSFISVRATSHATSTFTR